MGEHDMLGQTAGAYLRKSRMEEGMDTEEILREALRYTGEEYQDLDD